MQGLARAALSPRLLIHILLCAALLLRDLHTFPGVLSPEGSLLRLGGGGGGRGFGLCGCHVLPAPSFAC